MRASPWSSTAKKIPAEFGDHVKLPTDRSKCSVRSRVFPDCRSCNRSRHLSASKPARACERQARYFPSGEYSGVVSAPGLVEILWLGLPDREFEDNRLEADSTLSGTVK